MTPSNLKKTIAEKGPLDLKSHFLIQRFQMGKLFLLTLIFISLIILYFINLLQWSRWPEFGWSVSSQMGGKVFAEVYGEAEKAGLRSGDLVISVNGGKITSYHQLRRHLNREPEGQNIYQVDRVGKILTIPVPNTPLGLSKAFTTYGVTWAFGIIFFAMGVAVFLMKPGSRASWAFLLCTFNAGLYIAFSYTSKFTPAWLENVLIYASVFLSASILHIAQVFPAERSWVGKSRLFVWIPYLLSLILFIIVRSSAPLFSDVPASLRTSTDFYRIATFLIFLGFTSYNFIKPSSALTRVRSEVILIGFALAIGFPILDLLANYLLRLVVLPSPVFFLPFYAVLPLAIGYSIARHNLFDVDVYIKRAVGYALMTLLVGAAYFSTQMGIRKLVLQPFIGPYVGEIYPVLFSFLIVFFFNPVRNRIQRLVDRIFYRLEYDYQGTVEKISAGMRSLLNLDQIKKKIIDLASGVMFIDSVSVMVLNPEQKAYEGLSVSYASPLSTLRFPGDDPLFHKMADEKKEVTVYDVQEDPSFDKDRDAYKKVFDQLGATLIVPLIYEDRLTGLISLGNKKTGKFYRREDINLLKTMANQGAVAIENARLADQMKSEEAVRANLARYLSPQIVDQVIKKKVEVNLGGDRKVVTILFSDIRNFTRISESMPPDKLVELLNEYFTEMARIIFENQGSLDKYIGDAIVAVFGSLIPLENPRRTAVQAAVQMMKEMSSLNEKWKNQYGFTMEIGIGINTGEVFLGNVGSPERMEFTVIGDTVNIASRFSGVAKGSQILITKDTLARLGSDIKFRELEPVEVKGKTGKLEVYEIIY